MLTLMMALVACNNTPTITLPEEPEVAEAYKPTPLACDDRNGDGYDVTIAYGRKERERTLFISESWTVEDEHGSTTARFSQVNWENEYQVYLVGVTCDDEGDLAVQKGEEWSKLDMGCYDLALGYELNPDPDVLAQMDCTDERRVSTCDKGVVLLDVTFRENGEVETETAEFQRCDYWLGFPKETIRWKPVKVEEPEVEETKEPKTEEPETEPATE